MSTRLVIAAVVAVLALGAGPAIAADVIYNDFAPASGHTIPRRAVDMGDSTWADREITSVGSATTPVQGTTLFNSQTTGAANTAVVVTIAATAAQRAALHQLEYVCSAGSATLTVQDGGTTIYSVTAGTTRTAKEWATALTGTTNTAMTITLAACGVGNTGTLFVQASRF